MKPTLLAHSPSSCPRLLIGIYTFYGNWSIETFEETNRIEVNNCSVKKVREEIVGREQVTPTNIQRSGFDSGIQAGRYDSSLRVYPPITLTPGNKLISSRSAEGSNLSCVMCPYDTSASSSMASVSSRSSASSFEWREKYHRAAHTSRRIPTAAAM